MSKQWEVTLRVERPIGGGAQEFTSSGYRTATMGQITTMVMSGPDNFVAARALFESFGRVIALREKTGF